MIAEIAKKRPTIHDTAYIAPNAMVAGDVTVGPHTRVLFGAQLIAEGGAIRIGRECVIMENAVLRSTARHALALGDNCLVGPNAHVVGCTIQDRVFIATGACIFHAANIASDCEVRINAVVHLKTRLEKGTVVPIGWVAVGAPATILPPGQHDAIWKAQEPLNFPQTVYGIPRAEATTDAITRYLCGALPSDIVPIDEDR